MKKIAFLALFMAGIIGWAVRDDAVSRPPGSAASTPGAPLARLSREQYARQVRDNAALRASLQQRLPEVWRVLAQQTRRDLTTCVVTEVLPGILKADCQYA